MKVKVELQAYLEEYSPDGEATFSYDLPDGSGVGDIVAKLGIPTDLASIIVVNGGVGDTAKPLAEGDHVILIPPLAGGAA